VQALTTRQIGKERRGHREDGAKTYVCHLRKTHPQKTLSTTETDEEELERRRRRRKREPKKKGWGGVR
jgi:uncharacterized short protein YbdD (DUF466 family)